MNIPDSLIKRIQQKKIVVFVGAGLSISAGFPNWSELVITILDGIGDRDSKIPKYIKAIQEDILTPLEVLSKIEEYHEFAIEYLEKAIKKPKIGIKSTIHEKISELSSMIITTNYDSLLENTLSDYEKISYTNSYKIAKISEYDKYIFKIHGDIDEPDKCILFPQQYKKLYEDETASSIFELKKIISDKSLLFLGFSLNDPYINYIRLSSKKHIVYS